MSLSAASNSLNDQRVRSSHPQDLRSSAVQRVLSTLPRRSTRIAAQRPEDFVKNLAELLFAKIPRGQVFTEKSQAAIIKILSTAELQLDPSQRHHNPNAPSGYFSSSYDAGRGTYVTPRGGYGAPQDVNASFCHDHTDKSFKKIHPDVDLDAYRAPVSSRGRKTRSRTKSNNPTVTVPTIVVTDTETASQPSFDEHGQVAVQGALFNLKTDLHEAYSTIAVTGVAGKENNMDSQTITCEAAAADEHTGAATAADAAEKTYSNDDTSVGIEDATLSDTEESLSHSQRVDSSALSHDSGYGTQLHLDDISLFDDDDDVPEDVADCGNSNLNGGADDDGPAVHRHKITPKKPTATRRSSRISPHAVDPQPLLDSSLGKHKRQADADTNIQEPEGKRTKATQP